MAGLTRATELNGQKGVVEGFDAGGSGRYRVRLNGRVRPVNAKPEHVRWLRNTRITCYDGALKGNENGLHEEAPTADLIAAWREEESEIARLLQATDTCSTPSAEREGLQSSPILVAGLEGEEDGSGNGNERGCLVSLFDAACGLSYVSLRGCGLTASFATAAAAALPVAICLSALDLSSNALGDTGMCTLLKAAALAPRLTHVSVASNNKPSADSSGECFTSSGYMVAAAELLFGRAKTDDDAAALNAGAKAVADYNKGLKDMVRQ